MSQKVPARPTRRVAASAAAALFAATFAGDALAKPKPVTGGGGSLPPLVPAATEFDLTATNTSGSQTIGGALFQRTDLQPTGTGVIDPFLRLQSPGSSPVESGHNTSDRPLQFDENNSPNFTRPVLIDDLAVFNVGGVDYYKLLLDLNESNGGKNSLVSLDEFELYQSDDAALNGYNATTKFGSNATLVFDLDAGFDRYVKLDANINSGGSGSGDVFTFVPKSLFGDDGDYLYLFSSFGGHFAADGGFEEWAAFQGDAPPPPNVIPLPPAAWTGLASMAVLLGGAGYRRLRSRA